MYIIWKSLTIPAYVCIFVLVALEGVFLVDFSATNLNLSTTELTARLNETLTRCEEELHKVEEIAKVRRIPVVI